MTFPYRINPTLSATYHHHPTSSGPGSDPFHLSLPPLSNFSPTAHSISLRALQAAVGLSQLLFRSCGMSSIRDWELRKQSQHRGKDFNPEILVSSHTLLKYMATRLHDQLQPNRVSFEYAYDNTTVAFMKSLGHNVTWVAPGQSTAQGLTRLVNGSFVAAGEPRQRASGGFAI